MKIKKVDNTRFRNNEHFQFQTEFKDLVEEQTPAALKIESQYSNYLPCYADEDTVLQKIVKSATTENIDAADKTRDSTFRGMVDTNRGALNHFDSEVRAAAKRLQVVFDTFGNLAAKPVNEETSAIYNLLQELSANYMADAQKVGIVGWGTELDANNKALEALVKSRNDENAAKTELKMKETRVETDKWYTTIVERINALIIVEGADAYEVFVRKLNGYIDKYNDIVAQRYGKAAAKKAREEEEKKKAEDN